MSFHNKPNYQIPELIEALKAHRLPHDTPSQLADSFRIGWMACREPAQAADSVQEAQEPCPSCMNSDIYACTCTFPKSRNTAPQPSPAAQEDAARESEYRRGYRHGYEQRDAEVRGAMA